MLELPDHSEYMIVEDDLYHRNVISHRSHELLHIHPEAAISRNIDDSPVRESRPGTDRSAKTVPHRSKAAGCEKCSGLLKFIVLGCPHLMLSDIRHDDRISFCLAVQFLDDRRPGQFRLIIFQRVFFLHPVDHPDPVRVFSAADLRI